MKFGAVTPILRIFDEVKAREFYVDFLGFTVGFEHHFEPGAPLYMQVSRGDCRLHLSEHHGDASPGAKVRKRSTMSMHCTPSSSASATSITARASRRCRGGRAR